MVDRSSGIGVTRSEIFFACTKFVAAGIISYLTVRWISKYTDPLHFSKEQDKSKAKKLLKSLGLDESIELNDYENRIATQFVSSADGVNWSDLGGCESLIRDLNDRIILPLKIRNEDENFSLSSNLLSPPKGVLLYGPPGCGKTLIAKALARAARARFINLQVSNLVDKWYGESQKLAAAVFSVAEKFQPTIIFIDEIDSFLRDRKSHDHEATAMMKAEFMSLWDGFASSASAVILMGATNRPQDVDSAILRRMPARFYIPLPDTESRSKILRVILKEEPVESGIDYNNIAKMADALSGSDLKEVCRLAVISRVKYVVSRGISLHDQASRMVTEKDLIDAVNKYRETDLRTPLSFLIQESLD